MVKKISGLIQKRIVKNEYNMKISIKNNWKEITISDFNRMNDINDKFSDEYDKQIEIISVLTGIEFDDVLNIDLSTFNNLINESKFLSEKLEPIIPDKQYNLNGAIYDVILNINHLKAGQWIDIISWQKSTGKRLEDFLSIIMCPGGEVYSLSIRDKTRLDVLNYMSIVDANNISNFFLLIWKSITNSTESYLVSKMKKSIQKLSKKEKEKLKTQIAEFNRLIKNGGLK